MTEQSKPAYRSGERCPAEYTFPPYTRPRVVRCVHTLGHEGLHFAAWGGSQKWRQMSFDDSGVPEANRRIPAERDAEVTEPVTKSPAVTLDANAPSSPLENDG